MNENYERWLEDVNHAHETRASLQAQAVVFLASISRSLAVVADELAVIADANMEVKE